MAGKHGVDSIKQAVTVLKLGVISVLQNVQKDGFQVTDLFAPLESPTFKAELDKAALSIKNVLPELAEIDGSDGWELSMFAISVYKDIKTELKPALEAVRRLEKKA